MKTKLKRIGFLCLFILAILYFISKMYIIMPALGMVIFFVLGFLAAKLV